MNKHLFVVAIIIASTVGLPLRAEEPEKTSVPKLGEVVWTQPGKELIRVTLYLKEDGRSASKLKLEHADEDSLGSAAVPSWLPKGSLVRIYDEHGKTYVFFCIDEGPAVEKRTAAKELGSNPEERNASVIDICMPRGLWKDFPHFQYAEIWKYVGTRPFEALSKEEQKAVRAEAVKIAAVK